MVHWRKIKHITGLGGNLSKGVDVCTFLLESSWLAVDRCDVALVTIDVLPDLALLTIFDFYMDEKKIETWHTLVHVCRKWRNVVFGSPRRLKLRLCCTASSLRRCKLDVWPRLPIVVRGDGHEKPGVDYIIAALKHNDRVCDINFCWAGCWHSRSQMEEVLTAMQQPFPALTHLVVEARTIEVSIVPASFLGGSATRLQSLCLRCIPFPRLPNLLLSATHLVNLQLLDIPHSGYISPEIMVTSLSVLTRLERFQISFDSPRSRPRRKSRRPFPQTLTLLPALTGLWFGGAHQYLEDLVAQIDAPLLNELYISFSTFGTPPLTPFFSRISMPKPDNEARVFFSETGVVINFPRTIDGALKLEVSGDETEQQLSWTARLCSSSLPQSLISVVEHLYIETEEEWKLNWLLLDDETENSQWLELLRPFTSVKCLYITYGFERLFARAMEGLIGERVTEVLPALQTIFLQNFYEKERIQKYFGPLAAARQLAGHPISFSISEGMYF